MGVKGESVLVVVMVASMLVVYPFVHVQAGISCMKVTYMLLPCIPYAISGGEVPEECCSGIKDSLALAKNNEDLKLKCQCVKDGAALIPGLNYTKVNELPAKCSINVPYEVSPNTDCSKVHY